jgi:uncharacterized membrane protein YidH (DUF202 family)
MINGRPEALPLRDPGLQSERTVLAWRRTLLALIAADFFVWRAWLVSMHPRTEYAPLAGLGLGLAATAAAVATVLMASCVLYRAHVLRAARGAPSAWLLLTATGALTILAAAVVVSILLSA